MAGGQANCAAAQSFVENLPPESVLRAEQSLIGTLAWCGGDKAQAARYFDMAFADADDAWEARSAGTSAAAVVDEVGEAAAQVNSANALMKAQKLRDSSAQAIAMLAVARVVSSNGVVQ